jgi:high frequency lysogenization protein
MTSTDGNAVLALAGTLQALSEVRRIATHGAADHRLVEAPVRALLATYDGDLAALYGGRDAVHTGLRLLCDHLMQPQDAELTRYLVAVLTVERRLTRNRAIFSTLVEGIGAAARQADYFSDALHPNVVQNVGDLYSRTVSTLRPRIMVKGERAYLEDERNAALIRTLLLAAIRGVSLWREAGGRRAHLIFRRARLVEETRKLLATI